MHRRKNFYFKFAGGEAYKNPKSLNKWQLSYSTCYHPAQNDNFYTNNTIYLHKISNHHKQPQQMPVPSPTCPPFYTFRL